MRCLHRNENRCSKSIEKHVDQCSIWRRLINIHIICLLYYIIYKIMLIKNMRKCNNIHVFYANKKHVLEKSERICLEKEPGVFSRAFNSQWGWGWTTLSSVLTAWWSDPALVYANGIVARQDFEHRSCQRIYFITWRSCDRLKSSMRRWVWYNLDAAAVLDVILNVFLCFQALIHCTCIPPMRHRSSCAKLCARQYWTKVR